MSTLLHWALTTDWQAMAGFVLPTLAWLVFVIKVFGTDSQLTPEDAERIPGDW